MAPRRGLSPQETVTVFTCLDGTAFLTKSAPKKERVLFFRGRASCGEEALSHLRPIARASMSRFSNYLYKPPLQQHARLILVSSFILVYSLVLVYIAHLPPDGPIRAARSLLQGCETCCEISAVRGLPGNLTQ